MENFANSTNQQIIAQGVSQTRYREFTITIPANGVYELFEVFNYFRVLAAGGTIQVQFGDDPVRSTFTGAGIGLRFENLPNRLVLVNTSGGSNVITFAVAIGYINDDRLNFSGVIDADTTSTAPLISTADVTVATTVTSIIAANVSRRGVIITNIGSTNIRVGDASITTTRGSILFPNQSITLDSVQQVYGIASGSSSSVSVLEY